MRFRSSTGQLGLIALAGLLVACTGCSTLLMGIPGSGIAATENRDVEPFDKLDVSGMGTITVVFGEEHSLEVTGDDNLLEFVETFVENGTLRIRLRERIDPEVDLKFDIVTTDLSGVDISGAAKLNVQAAQLDSLDLSASGACNVNADGTADKLVIDISGAAKIDVDELLAKSVQISISGAGKADVYASESLDASVSGAGLIRCAGNPPDVSRSVSGVGRIQVDD